VTRAKSNLLAHRLYSAPTDRAAGVIADQTISLDGVRTSQADWITDTMGLPLTTS
jgi:hypothetical protein